MPNLRSLRLILLDPLRYLDTSIPFHLPWPADHDIHTSEAVRHLQRKISVVSLTPCINDQTGVSLNDVCCATEDRINELECYYTSYDHDPDWRYCFDGTRSRIRAIHALGIPVTEEFLGPHFQYPVSPNEECTNKSLCQYCWPFEEWRFNEEDYARGCQGTKVEAEKGEQG